MRPPTLSLSLRVRLGIAFTAAGVSSGCTDRPLPPAPGGAAVLAAVPVLAPPYGRVVGIDSVFMTLSDSIPGFGGYVYASDGRAVVFLTDLARAPQVLPRLRALVRGNRFSAAEVRFARGTFTFRQLAVWKQALMYALAGSPGFVFADADEAINRVTIGVQDGVLLDVASVAARLGVPLEAVNVTRTTPVRQAALLTSSVRPTVGALGIDNGRATCTLGFNGIRYGEPGRFGLTNSHCTRVTGSSTTGGQPRGGTESTPFYQPGDPNYPPTTADRVGTEAYDPLWYPGGTSPSGLPCPPNFTCRLSDAALFKYSLANSQVSVGFVVRTVGGLNSATVNLTIDNANPYIEIFDVQGEPMAGDSTSTPSDGSSIGTPEVYRMHKIGATTGWTSDRMNRSCVDVDALDQNGAPSGSLLFCQQVVRANADAGDSGSPVFSGLPDPYAQNGRARAYGLLWGTSPAVPGGRGPEFYLSDFYNISEEMHICVPRQCAP